MRAKRVKAAVDFAESVFKDYGQQLHSFLMRRLKHAHDAEDLAQQVYVELLRVEHSELVKNPRGYALRIAANVVSDFQRNAFSRARVSFDSETVERVTEHPPHIDSEEMASQVLNAQLLRKAFTRLPPLHQAAFVLQARDGYSYEETAVRLNVSVRRVERLLAEAKELLQTLLIQDER
jgi:RNA polymerase sigma factor (sigma-70 family)